MKKILLPLDGCHFPRESIDFVSMIQTQAPVLLAAALTPLPDYADVGSCC